MAEDIRSLPPLDLARAPEGGEIGPVQSGWRLAFREFAANRLAVIGVGILVFFVLFCFVGPLVYHGNVVSTDLQSTNLPRDPVIRSAPPTWASTNWDCS
jgi:N-terminal TM domain of oligopeptide transport permease C